MSAVNPSRPSQRGLLGCNLRDSWDFRWFRDGCGPDRICQATFAVSAKRRANSAMQQLRLLACGTMWPVGC